ncbi:hypothetical protein NQ314_015517 [Rhamnusium bicolor]|uniref:DDE Tnp4 domain-containing protein n=1 Tax=Rhamnusium bicolor TaxID=1586634 RepID=A0AAV8WY84_9CUCU|nr:hypothetical protein NQ314_015517 [Rhamnusium bicolor]
MSHRRRRAAAAAVFIAISRKQRREKTRKRIWVKEWIAKRPTFGAYTMLLEELRSEDPKQLKIFLRMSETDFNFLLQLVSDKISKLDTNMRESNKPKERKVLTLRFLATGRRISDGGVFNDCGLSTALQENTLNLPPPLSGRTKQVPYVVVADDAFALKPHLMKPIPLAPEKVKIIITTICVLHNFLMSRKTSTNLYVQPGTFDVESDENGSWRNKGLPKKNLLPLQNGSAHNYSVTAKEIREEFRDYFVSAEGEVSWQYKHI